MISVMEAREEILTRIAPLGTEWVGLTDALGRVLAAPLRAVCDQPPWDNSAMDGYAVRHSEIREARPDSPVVLDVIEEIPAGAIPKRTIGPGQASRIMTGAPMPDGADAVIPVEETRGGGGQVEIGRPVDAGGNVRPRGEDFLAGTEILPRGRRFGPAEIGLSASAGHATLPVYKRPRVAVLATGDELAEPGEEAADGRIVNSNSYALAAQVIEAGGIPILLGIARDRPESLREKLAQAVVSDLVVISGGVSVGDYDFVKAVLAESGAVLNFWRVAMKPGAPVAFGSLQGKPVFGLPGNPVSAMVTFELFARPALKRMQGLSRIYRAVIEAALAGPFTKAAGKAHFLRAILERRGNHYSVRPVQNQSSGRLSSMVEADGLMIAPAETVKIEAGQNVGVLLLNGGADQDSPGY